ncbi:MAG: nucleotidyltransferase domain-containing protein [Bacteroidota bacterium]
MKFGLPEVTYRSLQDYFHQQPAIWRVIIYGSRGMGTHEPASDIDLALEVEVDDTVEAFFLIGRIKTELEELPTPYRFDVTDLGTLKHDGLREHINRIGKVFYHRRKSTPQEKLI